MNNLQYKIIKYFAVFSIVCLIIACDKPGADFIKPEYEAPRFSNPVAGPSLTNPSVLRTWDGWFYAFGSEETWTGLGGLRLMPVMKSADLVNWTYQRAAFGSRPAWHSGLLSSPDVVEVNRRSYLYYTYGNANDPMVSIGIGTAFSPAGPYADRSDFEEMSDKPGNLLDVDSVDIADPRHPFFFEDGEMGPKYLLWTSKAAAEKSGVYIVQLSDNGLRVPDFHSNSKVASGTLDGVVVHKRDNDYYLFGTKVEGTTSRIVVGKSRQLHGPYLDKDGTDLKDDDGGSTFVDATATFRTPGHNTRIFTDKNSEDWIMFHAVDTRDPVFSTNLEKRPLLLAKVVWNNGWPEVVADYLTSNEVIGPNFY